MSNLTTTRFLISLTLLTAAGCAPANNQDEIPSAESVQCPATVAAWSSGTAYAVNALVSYQGTVYRCVQSHTALDTWTPDAVPALWSAVTCASGGAAKPPAMGPAAPPPATGGTTCDPGLTVSCPGNIPDWAPMVSYAAANLVRYQSRVYRCVQAHTSLDSWTPDAVPALWAPVDCAGAPVPCPPAPPPVTPPAPTPPPVTPPAPTPPPATGGAGAGLMFSAYKDTSINMDWNTNVASTMVSGARTAVAGDLVATGAKTITLAFATGECGSENWGGVPGAAMATANVPLLTKAGASYILSTGGAAGSFTCGSDAGMSAFINRWASPNLIGVDFDIEAGQSQAVIEALVQRMKAAHATFPNLRFSLTLATLANNNGASSAQSLGASLADSFNVYGDQTLAAVRNTLGFSGASSWPAWVTVNLMTMDYGSPSAGVCVVSGGTCQMGQSAIQAAYNLHDKWGVPFSGIEITPMIGGNDVAGEQFTLADADAVAHFAISMGLAGVHHWSYDRDIDCPAGSASPTCNSLGGAGAHGFTKRFLAAGLH